MSKWFRKREKGKAKPEPHLIVRPPSSEGKEENGRPLSSNEGNISRPNSNSPMSISEDVELPRDVSRSSFTATIDLFESLSRNQNSPERYWKGNTGSPEKMSSPSNPPYSSHSLTPTRDPSRSVRRNSQPGLSLTSRSSMPTYHSTPTDGETVSHPFSQDSSFDIRLEVGKEKEFEGIKLNLPPIKTSRVRHRDITSIKNPILGGFGFNLRKSFQPDPEDPEKPLLVHLVEPRPNYIGPLMTGDRILEVNGEDVQNSPHERVVDIIKRSGDVVDMKVASVPELMELNERGVFDDTTEVVVTTGSMVRKPAKGGAGTLRMIAAQRRQKSNFQDFQAKPEAQVDWEKDMMQQDKVWVVHRQGFSLGIVDKDFSPQKSSLSSHVSIIRSHGKRIKLLDSNDSVEVDEIDLEKANPSSLDRVEDLIQLVHLNECSVLHVLRQRYASSLIHTFVGRHLIVINPLRPLSLYSDRVTEMFKGCRREDMPPHIFAAGQQAYHKMLQSNTDQSLVLMGISGSGKTFNARYLLRYLATVGQVEGGPVTYSKLDAVQLLLHTFTSAATFLNPQATRCSCLYSMEFDSSGSLTAASVRTFLLEKTRIALCPEGEGSFNILYQLIAGADDTLRKELLLDVHPGTDEPNHYVEPHKEDQKIESAACVWDLIQNCLSILDITSDEALGLWSLLAAIFHLGHAGVKPGSARISDRFINPAAAQRAASLLGIHHEELAKDIFNPPRGMSSRVSSLLSSTLSTSPTISDTSSINLSISSFNISPGSARANRSFSLDAFVMGLFEYALSALVLLINRSLQPSSRSKGKHLIHVLDTPGFQHRELAGCEEGSSFDDLCMNYARERLQMLFHDSTFTIEQERYHQENIEWTFSEMVMSPLSIIDVIDRHIPQRRGQSSFQGLPELSDRRGILWILEEESTFPGSTDVTFLEKVLTVHGEPDDFGDTLVKVDIDKWQFTIFHCQRSLPITYDIIGWRQRAREHPSTRVVGQVLAESKKKCIGSIFQGRGVAALSGSTSSMKVESQTTMRMARTLSFSNPTAGIKKSSICLRTKFQLDFLIDILRKTEQWYVHCLLCQSPHYLPGAIIPPNIKPPEDGATYGYIDVPLVRAQLRRGDIIPAARIFKQGFPDHMLYPAFRRRYTSLLKPEEKSCLPENDKDAVEFIISGLVRDRNSYRLGLSQIFFRANILSNLERQVEGRTHVMLVGFQAHLRGWLGRELRERLELQHAAAHVIQRNFVQSTIINVWPWWKLLQKLKPLLPVWKAEENVKEKDSQIETLKSKLANMEDERDALKDSEQRMSEKVADLLEQLQEAQETAHHASELLEQEQMEKRELFEQNQDATSSEHELVKRNEQLQWQIAELTILSNIKRSEGGKSGNTGKDEDESEAVLEKYWETRRELEMLRQRMSTERDDEIDRLQHAKKSLEKRLVDSESEVDDLRRNLAQVRKKASKFSSELNDLKLLLESQQTRNEELEKRQRKFDTDLSTAYEEVKTEKQAREKVEREKNLLEIEKSDLELKNKKLKDDFHQLENEKNEMEAEFIKRGSSDAESEIASLKRMKREIESKVEELEDEVDDLNVKIDSLQTSKSRLELGQQSLRSQHQREIEGRDDDMEQLKNTMNKKLKSMEQQLEEEHEKKQLAIKGRRDAERELAEFQARMSGDPEVEKKLRKQIKKYKALLEDAQEALEHEKESRNNAAVLRSLRSQLEDFELREATAVKAQKRLQSDMDELQAQCDEVSRLKIEIELQVTELQREKSDLESRLEEEQDEVEQLVAKQRQSITQLGTIQQQLTEANFKVEELQDAKHNLESKVTKLQQKVSELESDDTKQEKEASDLKVREMEQKLELEKSTNKRQETMISRLRGQLERLQSEKAEDTASKSNDAIKRLQKQIRDIREEVQEAERREQEQNKKRRAIETQLNETQVELQTVTADLKSAHKRIEGLQNALDGEGPGEESSDYEQDEEGEDPSPIRRRDNVSKTKKKALDMYEGSSDGSYHIGEFGSESSDEEMARLTVRKKQREKERLQIEEQLSSEDEFSTTKRNSKPRDEDKDHIKRRTRDSDDDDDADYKPRKRYNFSDEDDEPIDEVRKSRTRVSDEDEGTNKRKYNWRDLLSDEDENKDKKPVDESESKSSKRFDWSDDDIDLPKRRLKKYSDSEEDEKPTKTQKGRSYISSVEEIDKTNNSRTKYNFDGDNLTDERKPKYTQKSKYDFSDDSNDEKTITKRSPKSYKVDLSSDEDYKPRRSYKKYLSDDDSDDGKDLKSKRREQNITDEDLVIKPNTKKAWELSSDDEVQLRSSKDRPRISLPSDEETPVLKPTRKKSVDFISDEDDFPKLKHAPKRKDSKEQDTSGKQSNIKTHDSPSRKGGVKWEVEEKEKDVEIVDEDLKKTLEAAIEKVNTESFKSSRKRREGREGRRRSRNISNIGTSPDDSPKTTTETK